MRIRYHAISAVEELMVRKLNKSKITSDIWKAMAKNRYDAVVHEYERVRFASIGGKYFDIIEKTYATKFLKGSSVLHIGPATGRFTELLTKKKFRYIGIEISGEMAKASRKRIYNAQSEVIHADGENLPLAESLFDNVLCVRSFHFLPNPRKFLRDAYRVLKPDGRIILSFEIFLYTRLLVHKLSLLPVSTPPRKYHRINDVVSMSRDVGFKILWCSIATKLPLLVYWRSPFFVVKVLKLLHNYLSYKFGTVGLVVAEKG